MTVSDRDQRTLAGLRALLARQTSLRGAAEQLGRSKSTVHRLASAHEVPRRRGPKVKPEQERQIARRLATKEESLRVVARWVGVSKSTIHRRKQTRLRRVLGPGPRQVAFYRCPRGHTTNLDPCVQCQAEAAARVALARQRDKGQLAGRD